jgi:hypothetical protein
MIAKAHAMWATLRYCRRCGTVYLPGSPNAMPVATLATTLLHLAEQNR